MKTDHACFALPDDVLSPSILGEVLPNQRLAAKTVIEEKLGTANSCDELLSGLSSRGMEVMSRFVPTLMCGEESAVHVFQKEAKRVEVICAASNSSFLLAQIAAEEVEHERLLGLLRKCLPVPDDFADLRRRARFFFFRMASRDPLIHFARIVGLDSGVCITLNSLLQPSSELVNAPHAYQIWSRIWRDEARHVRISRQHVLDLGIEPAKLAEEGIYVRKKLADLLEPLGHDFDAIGVDPDKLFRRIIGPEQV